MLIATIIIYKQQISSINTPIYIILCDMNITSKAPDTNCIEIQTFYKN